MQQNGITWNSPAAMNEQNQEATTMAKQIKKAFKSVEHFFTIKRTGRIYNELD